MSDSQLNDPERRRQLPFRLIALSAPLAALVLGADTRDQSPDRVPGVERTAAVRFTPVELPGEADFAGLRISGAWRVTVDDPRFLGLSALQLVGGTKLLALSDSGVTVELPMPGLRSTSAQLRDLPDGPGYPTFKRYRDSEAMVLDADGRLQVAFENQHSLWEYAGTARGWRLAAARDWPANKGIEAMVEDHGGQLLLIPEGGREVLTLVGGRTVSRPLAGATGGIADAARLPDGRLVVAVREIGLGGLTNRLAWLERIGGGYRLRTFATLPLGRLDNVEGLAAEALPGGRTRLWAVTDNDGWRRTLLLRMEIDARSARPAQASARAR